MSRCSLALPPRFGSRLERHSCPRHEIAAKDRPDPGGKNHAAASGLIFSSVFARRSRAIAVS